MTTDNERERAQLDRDDTRPGEETTLMLVAVSGRDENNTVRGYRIVREATGNDIAAHLARKCRESLARETLENQTQAP